MSVNLTSLPLCHHNNDAGQVLDEPSNQPLVRNNDDGLDSTINTTMIPVPYHLKTKEFRYDRKNSSLARKNRKILCVIVSIIAFFIATVGVMLWIIYIASVKASEYETKRMTSPSSYTETSTARLDSFSEFDIETNETTPLLTTTSLHKNESGNTRTSDGIIQYSNWTITTDAQKSDKKVLFIVADGIPADVIENASVINIKYIQEMGAYTRAYVGGEKGTYSQTATISSPGYMSLLTGTWGNKHNVYNNYVKNPNYHYKNIFRLLKEQQPDKTIGIFSTWITNRVKLIGEGLSEAGNITFDYKFDGYELDRITYPHDKRSRYIYNIDQRVTNETSQCIRSDAPDLSWVYLQYTDDIGHYFGDGPQFSQSIMSLDDQIGRIWEAIDYRMKYHNEDWLTIITTDHGRDSKTGKHHAGQSVRERTTWIVTNSRETNSYFHDFQPGIVDILPTIARFMNFSIPVESKRELDGTPLIGTVSLIKPDVGMNGDQLKIHWTVLDNTGNVTVWLSTSNLFKKGMNDSYQLMETVPIEQKMVVIDVKQYPSDFYKLVLEGQYNTVNKWVYRQRRRNES